MSHSKTKFSVAWLKKKDGNGHLLQWWCHEHESDKFKAVCNLCEKDINVANNGCHALMQDAGMRIHREEAMVRYSSRESNILKPKEIGESSTSSSVEQDDVEMQSLEMSQEGTKQVSIKEFFIKKPTDTDILKRVVEEPCSSKDTESVMTVHDQIVKAETLWALKTASENFSFRA